MTDNAKRLSAAARVRRHRRRTRAARMVVDVEIDLATLPPALVALQFLEPHHIGDRVAIRGAIERLCRAIPNLPGAKRDNGT